jgi:tetratricopeptide (TPR) repeat protein
MMKMLRIRFSSLLLVVLAVAIPATATAAQDGEDFAEPTERQYELNEEALSEMSKGEYAKAASLLQESLHVQPLNITYLNLGRSYQKMDRCQDAREALEKVESAPRVEKPEPALIQKKADEYLAEIGDAECAAALDDEPRHRPRAVPVEQQQHRRVGEPRGRRCAAGREHPVSAACRGPA